MSRAAPEPVESLLELAQSLAAGRGELGPLLDDVARIRDEVERIALVVEGGGDAALVREILHTGLSHAGLGALLDDAPTLPALGARLTRLRALLASLALTRLPRDGAP